LGVQGGGLRLDTGLVGARQPQSAFLLERPQRAAQGDSDRYRRQPAQQLYGDAEGAQEKCRVDRLRGEDDAGPREGLRQAVDEERERGPQQVLTVGRHPARVKVAAFAQQGPRRQQRPRDPQAVARQDIRRRQ
jgi:hypothetical protein